MFSFYVWVFKIYLKWVVQGGFYPSDRKNCFNSLCQNMLIKCKISMKKEYTLYIPKTGIVLFNFEIYYTFFLQTRMSCHCLWSNFLYGHFCLPRFSSLIRLGRSKIREILTEYIAPPASRGRHKIIRAHDLKCIFQIFLILTTSHSYTSGSTAKPRNSTSSWFVKASRQDARHNESWMYISHTAWVCLLRFWKNCRNKTHGGCVKVNNLPEIYRYEFITFARAIYKIS